MCCAASSSYRFSMGPLQMGSFWLLFCSFLLLITVHTGDAIKCFECNSNNDTACAQEKPPVHYLKDCSEHKTGNNYSLCRKIVQNIEFEVNGLPPNTRVIRACGYEKSNYENRCYQRSGFGGRQEVCTCGTNECNTAAYMDSPLLALGFFTLMNILVSRCIF